MATARTFNLELDDVLDRLRSAAAELERAGDPEEIGETAAELLLAGQRLLVHLFGPV